jgi:hypothetical protein
MTRQNGAELASGVLGQPQIALNAPEQSEKAGENPAQGRHADCSPLFPEQQAGPLGTAA